MAMRCNIAWQKGLTAQINFLGSAKQIAPYH